MNDIAVKIMYIEGRPYCPVPNTARGSALYTVDRFLNGKPGRENHDQPQVTVASLAC